MTKGYAAPEVGKVYARAQELARQVGETPEISSVLWGIALFRLTRAEYEIGQEYGERLLLLAENLQDPALLVEAHYVLSHVALWSGEARAAHEHGEQALLVYDPQKQRAHIALYGQDSIVQCLTAAAPALWLLGYPDQALERIKRANTFAQAATLPYGIASALGSSAMVYQMRREGRASQEQAEATLRLSTEHGFSFWLVVGTMMRGWAFTEQGKVEEGMRLMHEILPAFRAMDAVLGMPFYLGLLAGTYAKGGQVEEGLATVAEALAFVHKNKERFYEAELYRLKGELTLQKFKACPEQSRRVQSSKPVLSGVEGSKGEDEAEECFQKAIDIAQKQEAKSWELRAATSLARLWQQQGKQAEARELLAPVYNWFTEGFDTADLKDAKALLDRLS